MQFKQKVTITKAGHIALNKACMEKHVLPEHEAAILYWDEENRKIGIALTAETESAGAIRLRRLLSGGGDIAALAFLRCYGLVGHKLHTGPVALEQTEHGEMIVVCLAHEGGRTP